MKHFEGRRERKELFYYREVVGTYLVIEIPASQRATRVCVYFFLYRYFSKNVFTFFHAASA